MKRTNVVKLVVDKEKHEKLKELGRRSGSSLKIARRLVRKTSGNCKGPDRAGKGMAEEQISDEEVRENSNSFQLIRCEESGRASRKSEEDFRNFACIR